MHLLFFVFFGRNVEDYGYVSYPVIHTPYSFGVDFRKLSFLQGKHKSQRLIYSVLCVFSWEQCNTSHLNTKGKLNTNHASNAAAAGQDNKTEKSRWTPRVGCPFNDYQLAPEDYPVLARTEYFSARARSYCH